MRFGLVLTAAFAGGLGAMAAVAAPPNTTTQAAVDQGRYLAAVIAQRDAATKRADELEATLNGVVAGYEQKLAWVLDNWVAKTPPEPVKAPAKK